MSGTRLPASQAGVNVVFDGRPASNNLAAGVSGANELMVASGGVTRASNVTGAAVVLKTGAGRLCRVVVNTLSAAITTFHDAATVGTVAAANLVFTVPVNAPVGSVYDIEMPLTTGLVCTPGASGVLSVSYV